MVAPRAPPRSIPHGNAGHRLRAAADDFEAASGVLVEAATAELKLLLVVGGFGHAFGRM
jgi:hypothetical protein